MFDFEALRLQLGASEGETQTRARMSASKHERKQQKLIERKEQKNAVVCHVPLY